MLVTPFICVLPGGRIMSVASNTVLNDRTLFCSSLAADGWHDQDGEKSYEWWHFDALSDDGREALVITFTDNYVFSPRYAAPPGSGPDKVYPPKRFPAISLLYSVNGKSIFRLVSEYTARQFKANPASAQCTIGKSSFHLDTASYGSGYMISIDIPIGPLNRLQGAFEWLSIESDLRAPDEEEEGDHASNSWNIAAPRSDVTGHIEVVDRKGRSKRRFSFRGTGYHDHVAGSESFNDVIKSRQWGRAHFVDTTVIYRLENKHGSDAPTAQFYLVRDGKVHQREASFEEQLFRRDKFGIRYPRRLGFTTEDGMRLRVKPYRVIASSFCEIRFLSEMTLMLRDGRPRRTIGFSEYIAPKNLKYRLFRRFSDLQIGKNGKGPIL